LTYVTKINNALVARIKRLRRSEQVLVINSDELDFAHNPQAQVVVRRRITGVLTNG